MTGVIDTANLTILDSKTTRGKPCVTAYLDLSTGEIVSPEVAYELGVRTIRPDAKQQRATKLERLRPEPRQFADFLLRFRDWRCKFLVPMERLVEWYATTHGKRPCHIRRYFKPLIAAGILDSPHTLNGDFMMNNRNAGRGDAKGDETKAYRIYDEERKKVERKRVLDKSSTS